jgi:hypothetical protein
MPFAPGKKHFDILGHGGSPVQSLPFHGNERQGMFTPRGLRTFQTRFRSLLSHNRVLHSFTASFSTIAPKSVQQQLRSSSKHSQQPRNRAKPVRITMSFRPGPQATEIVAPLGVIASTSISLSEPECVLFSVLLNTLKSYPELSATTVRVAGGWVRDKVRACCIDCVIFAHRIRST